MPARAYIPLIVMMLSACPVQAETMVEAWRAARSHDPSFLGATDMRTSQREAAAQARALFLPKLQLQAGLDDSRSKTDLDVPSAYEALVGGTVKGGKSSLDLILKQPIYDQSALATARALREKSKAAETNFSAQEQQLMLRVAEAWLGLLAVEDEIATLKAQKLALAREVTAAQARFALGSARITDVRESQAQYDQLTAQEFRALSQRELAQSQYVEITGSAFSGSYGLSGDFLPRAPSESLDQWQDRADAQAPLIRNAEYQRSAIRASLDQYRWYGRPQVSAIATYSGAWLKDGGGGLLAPRGLENYGVGLRLTVPLGTGGYYPSKLREASADARRADHDLEAARRDVRLQVQSAWLGVAYGVEEIKALKAALLSSELQLRAAVIGREVGNRTQSDVLSAQSLVLSNRRNLSATSYQYQKDRIRLAAAAGSLDEAILTSVEQDFAVTSHLTKPN